MRIENLDGPRVRPEFVVQALRDLEWLGLDWDGPVYMQSSGLGRLDAAIERLLAAGLAYPCVCSRADVRSAQSAPQQGDREVRYPGTCRGRFASVEHAERTGRAAGIRLRVPDGVVAIEDGVLGPAAIDVQAEVGDFLIGRRHGAPAYQLAVVVDDAEQGVTEVLRGSDLLPSAARQYQLQDALGLPHPRWFHVPLVTDVSGRRLAKRSDDLSLAELRAGGTDPRAIVAWAAMCSGMAVSERVSAREAVGAFELAALPRSDVQLGLAALERLRNAR